MTITKMGRLACLLGSTATMASIWVAPASADIVPVGGTCTNNAPITGETVDCTTATDGYLPVISAEGDSVVVNVASGVTLRPEAESTSVIDLLNGSTLNSEGTISTSFKDPAIQMQDQALINLLAGSLTESTGSGFPYGGEGLILAGSDATVNIAGEVRTDQVTALELGENAIVTINSGGTISTDLGGDGIFARNGLALDVQAGGSIAAGEGGNGVAVYGYYLDANTDPLAQIRIGGSVTSDFEAAILLSNNRDGLYGPSVKTLTVEPNAPPARQSAFIEVLAGGSVTSTEWIAIADEGAYGTGIDTALSIAGTVSTGSTDDIPVAIDLGVGNDSVRLFAGATVIGGIDGGDASYAMDEMYPEPYVAEFSATALPVSPIIEPPVVIEVPVDTDMDTLTFDGAAGTSGTLDFGVTPLANFEMIEKVGAGNWTLTGTMTTAYSNGMASVQVNEGKLIVDANAPVMGLAVNAGGVLGGSGIIGALTVNAGGILAPGNSIGTLSSTADITLAAGSFYTVEIAANGTSDLVTTTGAATLAGGVVIPVTVDPEANYIDGQVYKILNADGGLTGTFDGISENSALLDYALSYDANASYLTAKVTPTSFNAVAGTVN